jgi:hypothetical protein
LFRPRTKTGEADVKPWIVGGGYSVGPFVGVVQLPVEQASQKVGESFLSRIPTVPNDGNPREKGSIFEKNSIRAGCGNTQ